MIKKTKDISINILSVFIILISLFLTCFTVTNAWFTSTHQDGVEIVVNIGDLKLSLYQEISSTDVKIFTNSENSKSTTPKYIELNDVVHPDEDVGLILKLANEDPGSTSMYIRFKFELYIRGVAADTLLPCKIKEFDKPTSTSNGFTYKDGYYYYTNSSGENVEFARGDSATIMESFNVSYSDFINTDGSFKIINSDSLYIKLTVDASAIEIFS